MNDWIEVGQHLPSTDESYARHREHEYVEHPHALAEREREVQPDPKPARRVDRVTANRWRKSGLTDWRNVVLERRDTL